MQQKKGKVQEQDPTVVKGQDDVKFKLDQKVKEVELRRCAAKGSLTKPGMNARLNLRPKRRQVQGKVGVPLL